MLRLLPNPSTIGNVLSNVDSLGTRNWISLCRSVFNVLIHRDTGDNDSDWRWLVNSLGMGPPSLDEDALACSLIAGDKWLGKELFDPVIGNIYSPRGYLPILMCLYSLSPTIKN